MQPQPRPQWGVRVLANGRLGRSLGRTLEALLPGAGLAPLTELAGDRDQDIRRAWLASGPRGASAPRPVALHVSALENVGYRQLSQVVRCAMETGEVVLFVTPETDGVVVGPTFVPGRTACFSCRQLHRALANLPPSSAPLSPSGLPGMEDFHAPALDLDDDRLLALSALLGQQIVREARAWAPEGGATASEFGASAVFIPFDGRIGAPSWAPLLPSETCRVCAAVETFTGDLSQADWAQAAALSLHRHRPEVAHPDALPTARAKTYLVPTSNRPIHSVGIIGGDPAGLLAALTLRRALPRLRVCVIAPADAADRWTGMGITPEVVSFLHGSLGIDQSEFLTRVQPTLKLGTRFVEPQGDAFCSSYSRSHDFLAATQQSSLDALSLEAALIACGKAPVVRLPTGRLLSLLDHVSYGYHLETGPLMRYLRELLDRVGVEQIAGRVVGAALTDVGPAAQPEVESVVCEDGRRFAFDLYVDCTGADSTLMGKALGSPFVDFSASLPVDTFVSTSFERAEVGPPCTVLDMGPAGWGWSIPTRSRQHVGYAFSSRFDPLEEATRRIAAFPGTASIQSAPLRLGRHGDFWRGNVVALGEAYGVMDLVHWSGMQMAVFGLRELVRCFPADREHHSFKSVLNGLVRHRWETMRGILSLHYRCNRSDEPFWAECRRSVDITAAHDLLSAFQEQAPLALRRDSGLLKNLVLEHPFDLALVDTILLGMGCPPQYVVLPRGRSLWQCQHQYQRGTMSLVEGALDHSQALDALANHPDLLRKHFADQLAF